ncbi:uncharacterized protein LOC130647499 [Hydractinia symbiolongicarpus]|uniref:uncharacterized protein LOC130647499 n=1 Tax=Hydractinia symbiolongicarpus TaxID=13093 RepID=UPI002551151F|nr:uncharacterized protein LOC130647499 [Hydractinia symbiolongicarpus]
MFDGTCGEDNELKDSFIASRGRFQKFMKRNHLSCRRRTTMAQKDPVQLINKLVAFVIHIRRLNMKGEFNPSNIIPMDETPVWADMVSSTTVNKTGQKDVMLKTTGHEKVCVTVCLAAKGDGIKLKPYIVFSGAKRESAALNEEFKTKCIVASSGNGWIFKELTLLSYKSGKTDVRFARYKCF